MHANAPDAAAGIDPGAAAELAQILTQLGPVADRLGSRAVIAQYEADIGDPLRTRIGTSLAGTTGPLPRFLPVRDILRINFNMHGLVPAVAVPNRFVRSVRMPTDDNLASTMPYAPTLRAALDLVARYGDAAVPWYRRSVRRVGNALHISSGPIVPLGRIEPLATEIALATIHRIVATFVGDRLANARIHFALAPVSDPLVLAGRFSCPIEAGGDDNFMAIPAPWGDMPSPYHDPHAWAEGEARCDADIRLLTAAPLVSRVRAHVEPALDSGHVALLAETARPWAFRRACWHARWRMLAYRTTRSSMMHAGHARSTCSPNHCCRCPKLPSNWASPTRAISAASVASGSATAPAGCARGSPPRPLIDVHPRASGAN